MHKLSFILPGILLIMLGVTSPGKTPGRSMNCDTAAGSFLMPVEDVFMIAGRGLFVTGIIERGAVQPEDSVEIIGATGTIKTAVKLIEVFRKSVTEAKQGESVGLLLSGVEKSQVSRGMVICQPNTVKAYTEFRCRLRMNTKEEGGRSTGIANKYRPLLVMRTALISGQILLPEEKQLLQPGEEAEVSVLLSEPAVVEKDMEFLLREGGKTVGKGKVSSVGKP